MAEHRPPPETPAPACTPPDPGTPLSLLDRIRANDPAAWQRWLALYRPLVLFWCKCAGLSEPDSEDVSQDVFAAAAKGLAGFRRDRAGDTFRGWLRAITRNAVLVHFRRQRAQPQAVGGSEAQAQLLAVPDPLTAPAHGEDTEISRLYHRALEQVRCEFEPHTWQAFWLTVVEGRAPATLTAELGMSRAAIRQAKSRVLRRLKQEVGDLLD